MIFKTVCHGEWRVQGEASETLASGPPLWGPP